ncbi:MAG: CDP-alcohol phosphatidyltransferase family protein [Dehalococcoidales bacterium]|nr:CDP-alcohol phosphatidyltransferase family protein [Dehalococcoidales bacterium]
MVTVQELRKDLAYRITLPIARLLARTSITPNALSWIGFIITVAAAVVIYFGHTFAGGWVVLFAGLFDMMDGALARIANRSTTFGAVLDSTLDRVSEGLLLLAILAFYAVNGNAGWAILSGAAIIGSFMVSYIRARGEGIGLEMKEGWFTRSERVIVLALGLLLSTFTIALPIALGIIVVLSFLTAGQRLFLVWRKTRH